MKRLFIVLASLCFSLKAVAATPAQELLQTVSQSVNQLGRYDANITIISGDNTLVGRYSVDGDSYYIEVEQQKFFSDGKVKYEVNSELREVVIDVCADVQSNILDNPSRAFDFVDSSFEATILSAGETTQLLELKPTNEDIAIDTVFIEIDKESSLPRSISYEVDGDPIEIVITKISQREQAIESYSPDMYADYEIIDFR